MSLSNRYSRHDVKGPSLNLPEAVFFSRNIKQHQWTPKPSPKMAPHPHHRRIRVVDRVLDPFRPLHIYNTRLVE
jgi:hypothetical protein